MINIRFNLKNPKADKGLIFMRLRKSGRELKMSTQQKVPPKYWSKQKHRAKRGYIHADQLNKILGQLEIRASKAILSREVKDVEWSPSQLKKELLGSKRSHKNKRTLTGYFQEFIYSKQNIRKSGTIISYKNALATIKRFFAQSNIEDSLDAVTYRKRFEPIQKNKQSKNSIPFIFNSEANTTKARVEETINHIVAQRVDITVI